MTAATCCQMDSLTMTIVSANGVVDVELRTLAIALNSSDEWSTELATLPMTSQQWKNDRALGDVRDLFRLCLQSRTGCV